MKIIFIFILLLSSLYAQEPAFRIEHFNIEEGLSQSQVNCFLIDKLGYLWIGCQDGLNRYDGISFEIFRNDPGNLFSLSNNNITCMKVDEYGCIWIGTEGGGLNKFYNNKYFKNILNSKEFNSDFEHEIITALTLDGKGNLWAGTQKSGLIFIEKKSNKLIRICQHELLNSIVTSLVIDKNGMLWIGTEKGIYILRNDKLINQFKDIPADENIKTLFKDRNDNIWIGTASRGLFRYDFTSKKLLSITHFRSGNPIASNKINTIYEGKDGVIWIGTDRGLDRLDEDNNTYLHFDVNSIPALNDNFVRAIFEDNSGIIWVGTNYGGVNKLIKQKNFLSYRNLNEKPYSIWAIYQDLSSNLWFGTDNDGLIKLDRKNNRVTHFRNNPNDKNSISGNSVSAIIHDKQGGYWIGTYGYGLNYLDKYKKKFIKYNLFKYDEGLINFNLDRNNEKRIAHNYIYSIIEDKTGTIWVGTAEGLKKFDVSKQEFISYKNIPGDNTSLSNNRVLSLLDDGEYLWIGTYGGGLIKFNKATGKCICFKNDPKNQNSISNNSVSCVFKDKNNILWLGTDVGFNRFDPAKNKFTRFTEKDGLPNYVIYAVLSDNSDNLWLSTNNGISKYNPSINQFKNYTVKDGLESNEFNQGAYFKGKDDELFFGGIRGVNSFFPKNLLDNKHKPPVVISKIKIGNNEISSERISNNSLSISYYENFLNFEFIGLDFIDPSQNQYKYMMKGFDKEWIDAGNKRFASYTNLDPGEYEFKVIACNNDNVWNMKGASIKVIVIPPYWKTWWFYLIIVLIVVGITALIYRSRVNRLLEIERLRIKIASDLHDEVGSSLTKISMNAGMAEYEKSIEGVRIKLRKIEDSSREVVSSMSDIVWSIDSRNDTIGTVIDRMKNFSFNLFSDSEIQVHFETGKIDRNKKITIDVRQNIYLIFKEALNNAAKYSKATKIDITLRNENGHFIMSISDNGIGFTEKKGYEGNGLKNMEMRSKRINAKLEITDSCGITITLTRKEI